MSLWAARGQDGPRVRRGLGEYCQLDGIMRPCRLFFHINTGKPHLGGETYAIRILYHISPINATHKADSTTEAVNINI